MSEELKRLESLKGRLVNGFSIKRIPEKKRQWFIDFAREEFCDDRGMALAHLVDFYTGELGKGTEHLEIAIEVINDRLEKIENIINDSDNNNIKERLRADGSKVE